MNRINCIIILLVISLSCFAQGTLGDYQLAESLLRENARKLVKYDWVEPNWIDTSSAFWYKNNLGDKDKAFIYVNPEKQLKERAFDHLKLAVTLSEKMGEEYTDLRLPFNSFEYKENRKFIQFKVDTLNWKYDLKNYHLQKINETNDPVGLSPDKKWKAFILEHDLYVKSIESDDTIRLTFDGEEMFTYAWSPGWYRIINVDDPKEDDYSKAEVIWSPDSKKLISFRQDRRQVQKLYMLKSAPENSMRAQAWYYERALPGDSILPTMEYFVFDIEAKSKIRFDLPKFPAFLNWWPPEWAENSEKIFYSQYQRGYSSLDFLEIDPETGKVNLLINEFSNTNVDMGMMGWRLINSGEEIIWLSERDGWCHIYRFDGKGKLINRVTEGKWVVRSIKKVDRENRWIYFMASGKEEGRDPYLQHLYKIKFDGSELTLLTPEDAEHNVSFSDSLEFFVDNFSRVDLPPKAILRNAKTGEPVIDLEEADISELLATGWRYPEPFVVKARDRKTDIYGALFKPANFDPEKQYGIIDITYSGPHTYVTPKTFRSGYLGWNLNLAHVGFILVTVDGLGSAKRSKEFHDYSHKNLGDIGAEDHITAIKQLAETRPYMDTSKVGITGHSAGGYDAAHALLTHPEFYKVAVAAAGNHDHGMAKIWWPEMWQGVYGEHYIEQSNITLAENLEGKLLLVHGDIDNNVNPASTMRFVDALIDANRDFDLLILPNITHNFSGHRYFYRKQWDYFIENMYGIEPPKEYEIGAFE